MKILIISIIASIFVWRGFQMDYICMNEYSKNWGGGPIKIRCRQLTGRFEEKTIAKKTALEEEGTIADSNFLDLIQCEKKAFVFNSKVIEVEHVHYIEPYCTFKTDANFSYKNRFDTLVINGHVVDVQQEAAKISDNGFSDFYRSAPRKWLVAGMSTISTSKENYLLIEIDFPTVRSYSPVFFVLIFSLDKSKISFFDAEAKLDSYCPFFVDSNSDGYIEYINWRFNSIRTIGLKDSIVNLEKRITIEELDEFRLYRFNAPFRSKPREIKIKYRNSYGNYFEEEEE